MKYICSKQERKELHDLRIAVNMKSKKKFKKKKYAKKPMSNNQKRRVARDDKQWLYKKAREMKPTGAEIEFEKKLRELRISFKRQRVVYERGFAAIIDFWLRDYNLFIEIDGSVHLDPEQKEKDRVKDEICKNVLKIPVIRFTNKNAIKFSSTKILYILNKNDNNRKMKRPKSKDQIECEQMDAEFKEMFSGMFCK